MQRPDLAPRAQRHHERFVSLYLPRSASHYRDRMATKERSPRTVKTIDRELAQAAYRRMMHGDNEISRRSNMAAIDVLLDERLRVAGR